MRVLEIAEKLKLKENKYVLEKLPDWIEKSNSYADMMIENYGFNDVQTTREGYRLLFVLNHVCPNLYHFCKKPNWYPKCKADITEWNELMNNHLRENTQAAFRDSDGTLIQRGVHYTKKEFDAFIEAVEEIWDRDSENLYSFIATRFNSYRNSGKYSLETLRKIKEILEEN